MKPEGKKNNIMIAFTNRFGFVLLILYINLKIYTWYSQLIL